MQHEIFVVKTKMFRNNSVGVEAYISSAGFNTLHIQKVIREINWYRKVALSYFLHASFLSIIPVITQTFSVDTLYVPATILLYL